MMLALIGGILLLSVAAGHILFPTLSSLPNLPSIFIPSAPLSDTVERARVRHVIDGDTIVLADGRVVRYIGIDTPETGTGYTAHRECYARQATERNRELVEGKVVRMVRDVSQTDRYGRLLRYVYVGDVFVNDVLVREGYAVARRYPPDIRYSKELEAAQREAQRHRRGIHGACRYDELR